MRYLTYIKFGSIPLFLSITMLIVLTSCSKDVMDDYIGQDDDTEKTDPETSIPDSGNSILDINETECEFDLSSLSSDEILKIDCTIDLNGASVELPSNVVLEFNGGQIINGTLNFTGGKIAGELLNNTLLITGEAALVTDDFIFYKNRWDIKEGQINDEDALSNKDNLELSINQVHMLGGTNFTIPQLDAFFKVDLHHAGQGLVDNSIEIPSNFNFLMSEATYLRVQPNKLPWSILLCVYESENVIVKGGNLVGDRYIHDYEEFIDTHGFPRNTHEWHSLLTTAGSTNVKIENINISNSTSDGIVIGATTEFRYVEGSKFNSNITVSGCKISASRRNNISITDGEYITIQNNLIADAGNGENTYDTNGDIIYSSAGVAPKYGLDVEPYVTYGDHTYESIVKHEWVEHVTILNNEFIDNNAGSIIGYSGSDIDIISNFSDHSIALNNVFNCNISENSLIAGVNGANRIGISTGDYRRYTDFIGGNIEQYALNNNVKNNSIKGFYGGILVYGSESEISGNTLEDFAVGINIQKTEDTNIFENNLTSTKQNALGIIFAYYGNRIDVYHNDVNVDGRFFFVNDFNLDEKFSKNIGTFEVNVFENTLSSRLSGLINNSRGLNINSNAISGSTVFKGVSNMEFKDNNVDSDNYHGLTLDNCYTTIVTGNAIDTVANYDGVHIVNEPENSGNQIEF